MVYDIYVSYRTVADEAMDELSTYDQNAASDTHEGAVGFVVGFLLGVERHEGLDSVQTVQVRNLTHGTCSDVTLTVRRMLAAVGGRV